MTKTLGVNRRQLKPIVLTGAPRQTTPPKAAQHADSSASTPRPDATFVLSTAPTYGVSSAAAAITSMPPAQQSGSRSNMATPTLLPLSKGTAFRPLSTSSSMPEDLTLEPTSADYIRGIDHDRDAVASAAALARIDQTMHDVMKSPGLNAARPPMKALSARSDALQMTDTITNGVTQSPRKQHTKRKLEVQAVVTHEVAPAVVTVVDDEPLSHVQLPAAIVEHMIESVTHEPVSNGEHHIEVVETAIDSAEGTAIEVSMSDNSQASNDAVDNSQESKSEPIEVSQPPPPSAEPKARKRSLQPKSKMERVLAELAASAGYIDQRLTDDNAVREHKPRTRFEDESHVLEEQEWQRRRTKRANSLGETATMLDAVTAVLSQPIESPRVSKSKRRSKRSEQQHTNDAIATSQASTNGAHTAVEHQPTASSRAGRQSRRLSEQPNVEAITASQASTISNAGTTAADHQPAVNGRATRRSRRNDAHPEPDVVASQTSVAASLAQRLKASQPETVDAASNKRQRGGRRVNATSATSSDPAVSTDAVAQSKAKSTRQRRSAPEQELSLPQPTASQPSDAAPDDQPSQPEVFTRSGRRSVKRVVTDDRVEASQSSLVASQSPPPPPPQRKRVKSLPSQAEVQQPAETKQPPRSRKSQPTRRSDKSRSSSKASATPGVTTEANHTVAPTVPLRLPGTPLRKLKIRFKEDNSNSVIGDNKKALKPLVMSNINNNQLLDLDFLEQLMSGDLTSSSAPIVETVEVSETATSSDDSDSDSAAASAVNGHANSDDLAVAALDTSTPTTVNGRSLRVRDPDVRLRYSVDKYTNPHEYVECVWHRDKKQQPFQVCVERAAALMIELHSHLAHTEVIGWLAGEFDAKRNLLVVKRAYPVQCLELEDKHLNVEMDAVDASVQAEAIDAAGMQCVGWYHSHPYFENQPSTTDVQQHHNMQRMFARSDSCHNQFVAAICVPYGQLERKRWQGHTRWLYTRNDNGGSAKHSVHSSSSATNLYGGKVTPYELWYDILEYENRQALANALRDLFPRARLLYESLANYRYRIDFSTEWVPYPKLPVDAQSRAPPPPTAATPTRLTKLRASLAGLWPEEMDNAEGAITVLTSPLEDWKSTKTSIKRR